MRRRNRGLRRQVDIYRHATVMAACATGVVTILGCLLVAGERAAILIAGALTITLHLVTLISVQVGTKLSGYDTALALAGYGVKLVIFAATLWWVSSSGVAQTRTVVGVCAITIALSLVVMSAVVVRKRGLIVDAEDPDASQTSEKTDSALQ
ncbi:hypothetical protein [Trueperella bialowiezensis]|uniref:Uncharacterized protein n=1 Tax=Trueperella bialowiezensis TaxID=312285 RepID=A0A448PFR4_9ACTO|nr:hypothetical protein [Trueperella bialowiezensis]VEI13760.1 Uncharacterised protein [Trueperella bialowiezensis]